MANSVSDWSDFEWFVTHHIPRQTIAVLRAFASTVEDYTGDDVGLRSGDRKSDIISKVAYAFREIKARGNIETYRSIRQACEGFAMPARSYPSYNPPAPTFGGVPSLAPSSSGSSSFNAPHAAPLPSNSSFSRTNHSYPSSSSRPNGSGWGPAQGVSNVYQQRGSGPNHALMDWKHNPMWKPVRAVTSMELLPDIDGDQKSHTRREKRVTFTMPPDVAEKLRQSKASSNPPHYSLRLFCASSDHYKPAHAPYSASTAHIRNVSIPIEYPSNPDISVDYQNLSFKQRGLRGKPGSAPPFDLGSGTHGLNMSTSRMTNVVFGHTGPTTGKKKENWKRFWFQIVLAEMTTKDELLSRLMRLTPTSPEESIAKAKSKLDDDFEVGTSVMTLKDPLSYMRITRPVRSTQCSHTQCFDATWWIESNNQHPMWLCPLCNKELKFTDLIVDGYFLNILNAVPESVEEVMVESDFEWHTEDNKFGSQNWMNKNPGITNGHAVDIKPSIPEPTVTKSKSPSPDASASPDRKGKRKAIEILSSDDEEEDVPLSATANAGNGSITANGDSHTHHTNGLVPPPTASALALPQNGSTGGTRASSTITPAPEPGVIDLTVDSSDEGDDADEYDTSGPSQQHFHQPGAGSTSRAASSSIRPPSHQTNRSPYLDTANTGEATGVRHSHSPLATLSKRSPSAPFPNTTHTSNSPDTSTSLNASTSVQDRRPTSSSNTGSGPRFGQPSYMHNPHRPSYLPNLPPSRPSYDGAGYARETPSGGAYGSALSGGGHWSPLSGGPTGAQPLYSPRQDSYRSSSSSSYNTMFKKPRNTASDWMGEEWDDDQRYSRA